MTAIHEIASGVSDNSTGGDKFRNAFNAIGRANDAASISTSGFQSMVALLKAICAGLGLAAGSGTGVVNGNPNILDDGLVAIGEPNDSPATDTSSPWSAISVAKGILATAGFV